MSDSRSTFVKPINKSEHSLGEHFTPRQMVINQGLDFLDGIGSDEICSVCITNGGSCCKGCRKLVNGVGCKLRNTSCTAWLCGFLRYLLYEVDLLQDWNIFWRNVPGQAYREDYTPDSFVIYKTLTKRNIRFLSHELAEDLKTLSKNHSKQGYIIDLREKINNNLDELTFWKNSLEKQSFYKNNLQTLSKDFHRFHQALENYRKEFNKSK